MKALAVDLGELARIVDTGGQMNGQMNGRANGPNGPRPAEPRELATVWADDIEIALESGGLVDGLLGTTGFSVLYGESGAGKTFVAIDLACHVAAGLPWRGMDVEPGIVVYVAAEAPESVKRRLWAWKAHHGVDRLPVMVVQSAVDLLNGDADALVALVARVARDHGRVALVVVDTLARAMTGNENAPDDMGRFVAACGRIREACGGHVLVVHHSGKDTARGARGHSSLRAATDVELEVSSGEAGGSIKVTKHRDEAGGRAYGFRLETVELGTNGKGRTVTTCVAIEADAPSGGREKRRHMGANEKLAFDALTAALNDHGEPAPAARDIPPAARVAPVARWEDAAMRYLPQTEPKRKREAFNRALKALVASGAVRHAGGWAWLP